MGGEEEDSRIRNKPGKDEGKTMQGSLRKGLVSERLRVHFGDIDKG